MLVALAVVSTLAVILIVAAGGVRDRAATAASIANLRQCTAGILQLVNLRKGVLSVRAGGLGGGSPQNAFWCQQLERDLEVNRKVFFSEKSQHGLTGGIHDHANRFAWPWRISYGMNFTLSEWQPAPREDGQFPVKQLRLAALDRPASTILLASSMHPNGFGRPSIDQEGKGTGGSVHLRYNGRAAASFFDGSVRLLGPEELKDFGFTGAYGKDVSEWENF